MKFAFSTKISCSKVYAVCFYGLQYNFLCLWNNQQDQSDSKVNLRVTSTKLSDTCSGLPQDASYITDTKFPVNFDTEVTVRCPENHLQSGSNVISCVKGTSFKFTAQPVCSIVGKYCNIVNSMMSFFITKLKFQEIR